MIDETFLTTEEVLEYLQVNLRTVYRLIKAGKIPAVRVGNLIWLSGKTSKMTGKVGRDVTVEQGYEAAKECAIGLIATLRDELGDLDKVKDRRAHV